MSRIRLFVSCVPLLLPLPVRAEDPLQEVRDCLLRNVPKKSSSQTLHLHAFKRTGERTCRGKLLAAQLADGRRGVKVCMQEPEEVRGTEFLAVSAAGREPDQRVWLPDARKSKVLTGSARGGAVCDSDVSYEDLQRWQQLEGPEAATRMPDAELDGRSVYVLEAKPLDASQSHYTKVVSYLDKRTCVVIKSESFEGNDRLRKVMTTRPEDLFEHGGVFAPTALVVEDVRDGTHTDVEVDNIQIDGGFDPYSLDERKLGQHCR
jgi:hypothetical protein